MSDRRHEVGRLGERLAASHLEARGYTVLHRNYRCPVGEADLVVRGPDGLVFVEVRTKSLPSLVLPEETITRRKAERMVRTAEHFLMESGQEDAPWRVDVVGIQLGAGGELVRVEHFCDATSHLSL